MELETKSFLKHDLVHLAFEETAGLQNSFWGKLAKKEDPNTTNAMGREKFAPNTEIEFTEVITGPLMGLTQHPEALETTLKLLHETFEAYDVKTPHYLTKELLEAFLQRHKELTGQWNSLSFGETLNITWNV